jgi:nitrate reductase NapE component
METKDMMEQCMSMMGSMMDGGMMSTGGIMFMVLGLLVFLVLGLALVGGLGYLAVKRLGAY